MPDLFHQRLSALEQCEVNLMNCFDNEDWDAALAISEKRAALISDVIDTIGTCNDEQLIQVRKLLEKLAASEHNFISTASDNQKNIAAQLKKMKDAQKASIAYQACKE